MMGRFSRRGQPLIVLVLVLGGWVSARAMMWDPAAVPVVRSPVSSTEVTLAIPARALLPQPARPDYGAEAPISVPAMSVPAMSVPGQALPDEPVTLADQPEQGIAAPSGIARQPDWDAVPPAPASASTSPSGPRLVPVPAPRQLVAPPPKPVAMPVPAAVSAGHHLMWLAALSQIPMPATLLAMPDPTPRPVPFYPGGSQTLGSGGMGSRQRADRWSLDSWVLWRRGSTAALSGGLLIPSYGASQAGAVLRYRLAPGSALRPAAYLRTTAALNGSSEREVALGLSLRPIARLPVSLQGEARYTSTPVAHALRPAVLAVTELPPFTMPLGLRGEAYGQAGYVGGKFSTSFADGQLRVDRQLLRLGKAELRVGGGAWGGIQKGASRLDAGPSLTIGQPLGGPASIRLGADWRFRVAGKAAPGSGPAVTLSAGF